MVSKTAASIAQKPENLDTSDTNITANAGVQRTVKITQDEVKSLTLSAQTTEVVIGA